MFANIAKPLSCLAEVDILNTEEAFDKCAYVKLSIPDSWFILDTNTSNTSYESVLSQLQNRHDRVIGYFSEVLLKAERN